MLAVMRCSNLFALTCLGVCCALAVTTAGDAVAKPPAAGRGVTVRTVHTLPNVSLADAAGLLRQFATRPEAVVVDQAQRAVVITDTAERTARLLRLVHVLEQARPGEVPWVEHIHGWVLPSQLAERLQGLFDVDPAAAGKATLPSARFVGDDEAGVLLIVADEATYLRIAEIVHRIPSVDNTPGEVRVLPLQRADAEDVARRLRPMVERLQASPAPRGPAAPAGAAAGATGNPWLVADVATNSIVVGSASIEAGEALKDAVMAMDVPPTKTPLEVAVVERDREALFGASARLPPLRIRRGSRGLLREIYLAQREIEATAARAPPAKPVR